MSLWHADFFSYSRRFTHTSIYKDIYNTIYKITFVVVSTISFVNLFAFSTRAQEQERAEEQEQAEEQAEEQELQKANTVADLPDLPELPDLPNLENLDNPTAWQFLGQGRLRFDIDAGRTLQIPNITHAGLTSTARIGIHWHENQHQVAILFGVTDVFATDPILAQQLVLDRATGTTPFLQTLFWEFPVELAETLFSLRVGRFPYQLADGRLLGIESFDSRGNVVDGAVFSSRMMPSDTAFSTGYRAGLLLTKPTIGIPAQLTELPVVFFGDFSFATADLTAFSSENETSISGINTNSHANPDTNLHTNPHIDAHTMPQFLWESYVLFHREEQGSAIAGTLGSRWLSSWFGWDLHLGIDGQSLFLDALPLVPASLSGHFMGALRYRAAPAIAETPTASEINVPSNRWFLEISAEATTGDVTANRIFRQPSPTQHNVLGFLDFLALDNVASTAIRFGIDDNPLDFSAASNNPFFAHGQFWSSLRLSWMLDPTAHLLHPNGEILLKADDTRLSSPLFAEADLHWLWPLSEHLQCVVDYGLGIPLGFPNTNAATPPLQKFSLTLAWTLDHDDALPHWHAPTF